MPKTRNAHAAQRGHLHAVARHGVPGQRRTIVTLGDLILVATQVTGSTQAAARLLDESSPLGHLLDRRIVIG